MAKGWKLTVRRGSEVKRESFETAEEALDALEQAANSVRAEGPLDAVSALRNFAPGDQVAARLELSGPGLLRGREAGLDVKGDGSLVPYTGAIFKKPLDGDAYSALRGAVLSPSSD